MTEIVTNQYPYIETLTLDDELYYFNGSTGGQTDAQILASLPLTDDQLSVLGSAQSTAIDLIVWAYKSRGFALPSEMKLWPVRLKVEGANSFYFFRITIPGNIVAIIRVYSPTSITINYTYNSFFFDNVLCYSETDMETNFMNIFSQSPGCASVDTFEMNCFWVNEYYI